MPQPSTIGQQLTRYLRTLAGEHPAGGYFDVRCNHRGPGVGDMWRAMIAADELDRAGATISRRARAGDVYVGVALRLNPEFGGASAIESSHLAFVEIDTADARIRLGEFHHQPTMLLSSGTLGHLHAYWQLTRSLPNPELEATNRKLAHHLGGDLASVDAARVLRPPATYNRKRSPVRPSRSSRTRRP